jgi:hypothetical protein
VGVGVLGFVVVAVVVVSVAEPVTPFPFDVTVGVAGNDVDGACPPPPVPPTPPTPPPTPAPADPDLPNVIDLECVNVNAPPTPVLYPIGGRSGDVPFVCCAYACPWPFVPFVPPKFNGAVL